MNKLANIEELSKKIEYFMSQDDAAYVVASQTLNSNKSFASFKFDSGCACFTNHDPLTNTHGFGSLDSHDEKLLLDIEDFFYRYHSTSVISLPVGICPKAERLLLKCGYVPNKLMNIYILNEIKEIHLNDNVTIQEVKTSDPNQRQLWEKIVSCGFSNRSLDSNAFPDTISQGQSIKHGNHLFIAYLNGNIAGASSLYVNQKFARLGGMTTLPEFRGNGIQKQLLQYRLTLALKLGCTIITTNTDPNNISQKMLSNVDLS